MNKAEIVRAVSGNRIEWQRRALERMMERQISRDMVKEVLLSGDWIEEYSNQKPYPGALVLEWVRGQPLHVVLAFDSANKICFVITAYVPDLNHFEKDYRTRRQRED